MKDTLKLTPHTVTYSEEVLLQSDSGFSIKIGGKTYEVNTHFNPSGKQTVMEQFAELLSRANP